MSLWSTPRAGCYRAAFSAPRWMPAVALTRMPLLLAAALGFRSGAALAEEDAGALTDVSQAERSLHGVEGAARAAARGEAVMTVVARPPAQSTQLFLKPGGKPIAHLDTGVPLVVIGSAEAGAWLHVEVGSELVVRGWLPREVLGGFVRSAGKLGESSLWAASGDLVHITDGAGATAIDIVARARIPVYQALDQPAQSYWELAAAVTLPSTRLGKPDALNMVTDSDRGTPTTLSASGEAEQTPARALSSLADGAADRSAAPSASEDSARAGVCSASPEALRVVGVPRSESVTMFSASGLPRRVDGNVTAAASSQ